MAYKISVTLLLLQFLLQILLQFLHMLLEDSEFFCHHRQKKTFILLEYSKTYEESFVLVPET